MKVHAVFPADKQSRIFNRDASCFGADCFSGSFYQNIKCDGWSERSLTKSNVNPHKKKRLVSCENLLFEVDDFVAAVYRSNCQVYTEQNKNVDDDDAFISFL